MSITHAFSPRAHRGLPDARARARAQTRTLHRRIFVDSRLQYMLQLKFDIPFFERGDFPVSVSNESQQIILPDPWAGAGNSAPFDQCTSLTP